MDGLNSRCPSSPCNHDPRCTALIDKSVRRHIQSKSEKFSEYFDLDNTFYNSLVSRGVLTLNETDDIKRQNASTNDQCSIILTRLAKKTWGHLRQFCHLLHDRDEDYLLREVFGFTKDAASIESVVEQSNNYVTIRKSKNEINDVNGHLMRLYRQRFYSVEALGSKPFDLAKHYIDVQLSEGEDPDEQNSKYISEHEMFCADGLRAEYDDDYKKVLVSGPTGCGKTALCLHTAAKWGMKKEGTNSYLDRFKLVILLEPSLVLKCGVKGAIQELLPRQHSHLQTIFHYIETHGENCLVIVDDIDSILMNANDSTLEDVQNLIHGKLFDGCTLLATASRDLKEDDVRCFERKLTHNGFLPNQGLKFIQTYFGRNTELLRSLLNFLKGRTDDKRSVDEILKRPLWNLVLCQVWELQRRARGKKLNTTILYSHIEEALLGRKPDSRQQEEMRQLYRLCLYGVLHKVEFFDRALLRQFNIRKKSVAFHFLSKRTFITDDLREECGFIIPHRTLLFYFAAKEIHALKCPRSQWIFLNILLSTESFSEITVFLSGLLSIPNFIDLIFMHVLFRNGVCRESFGGDCVEAIERAKNMVSELYQESRRYILDKDDLSGDSALLDIEMLQMESFTQGLDDIKELPRLVKRMAKDVLSNICSRCFTKLFHLVMSQYKKIVWLLRCYYEYGDKKPQSDMMKKLNKAHNQQIFISRSESPHDFLVCEFSDNGVCTLKIPYATEVPHLQIMTDVLNQMMQERKQITELHISVGMDKSQVPEIEKVQTRSDSCRRQITECFQKLFDRGLSEISFSGLLPSYVALIMPGCVHGTIDKLTVTYFRSTDTWVTLLKHVSQLTITDLCFESLDVDVTGILSSILKSPPAFGENLDLLHLGHSTKVSKNVFHQYLQHGKVSVKFEHVNVGEASYAELTMDIDHIRATRSLYISYGSGSNSTKELLPSDLHIEKLRVRDIWSSENLSSLFGDISKGLTVEDLQIDHNYMSGFILKALSEHKESLAKYVEHIKVKHGTYTTDDFREFLMWQSFDPSPKVILDAPTLDGYSIEKVFMSKVSASEKLAVQFSYISGSKSYIPCLPAATDFEKISFNGFAYNRQSLWQEILKDVSKCQVKELEFQSSSYIDGDPCVQALSANIFCLKGTRKLVLRNLLFFETEMIDLMNLSTVVPLTLEKVEVGHMKFDSIQLANDIATEKQYAKMLCHYPQDFSDLLPTAHQLRQLTLELHSDYSLSMNTDPRPQNCSVSSSHSERWLRNSPRMQTSPSSVPRSTDTSPQKDSFEELDDEHMHSPPQSNSPAQYSISSHSDSEGCCKRRSPRNSNQSSKMHPSSSHSPKSLTGSNHSRKSMGGSSHFNSTGTENMSRGTQADSADTLMRELEKSFIDLVELNLERCEEDACEDLIQALVDHGELLANRMGELCLIAASVSSQMEDLYRQSKIGSLTTFVRKR